MLNIWASSPQSSSQIDISNMKHKLVLVKLVKYFELVVVNFLKTFCAVIGESFRASQTQGSSDRALAPQHFQWNLQVFFSVIVSFLAPEEIAFLGSMTLLPFHEGITRVLELCRELISIRVPRRERHALQPSRQICFKICWLWQAVTCEHKAPSTIFLIINGNSIKLLPLRTVSNKLSYYSALFWSEFGEGRLPHIRELYLLNVWA